MPKEYIIYCDESLFQLLRRRAVTYDDLLPVTESLRACKAEQNLHKETKWTRITVNYESKYIALINCFFDHVKVDRIKVRIMFTQNTVVARGLTQKHVEEKYFILYYMFIKHAFGLHCSPVIPGGVRLRVYPDQIPDTRERVEQFRGFIAGLARSPAFRHRKISIAHEDIADVDSKEHEILQCLDIVLGAMYF